MNFFYVQNKGYVGNCLLWWKKDRCGYTTDLKDALMLSELELIKFNKHKRPTDIIWSIEKVQDYAVIHVTQELERNEQHD